MQKARCAAAVLLAVVAVGGCGDDDSNEDGKESPPPQLSSAQRGVLSTIDDLQSASRGGRGTAICSNLFTKKLVASVRKASGTSCGAEVKEQLFDPKVSIAVKGPIQIKGSAANVVIDESNGNVSALSLLLERGRWRIDRVTPQKRG